MKSIRHWNAYQRRMTGGRAGFRIGLLRLFFSRRTTPEKIALGCAIGVFVAFLPVIGLQMLLALALAMMVKAHPLMAMAMTWVSNPVTIPPLLACSYRVGRVLLSGGNNPVPRVHLVLLLQRMEELSIREYPLLLLDGLKLGGRLFPYLLAGGLVNGLVCGLGVYPIVLFLSRRYRAVREKARQGRRKQVGV